MGARQANIVVWARQIGVIWA